MATKEGDVRVIREGLTFKRYFTRDGVHPFDEIEWETRDAVIPNYKEGGNAFEQRDVEFPVTWSQNATNIVAQKYFRGPLGTPQRESSVRQLVGRVVDTITGWGRKGRYFASDDDAKVFSDELSHLLVTQKAAFNSPVWFNVGVPDTPQQCSACFILAVDDTMSSILNWYVEEGTIFKGGSGSGINLSRIRSSREPLAGGGTASGPVSFMRGADASAGTIKSGGKTRRAAKMVILDVDHPDVSDFIWCKAREEQKARALRDAGFDMDLDGRDAYSIQYQNANNSVRVTDEFMKAFEQDQDWKLKAVITDETVETVRARELMREIAQAAWECADPGMQYDTTINEWHTCPATGRINASNPCSEYMHLDNSACNLASLNLMKFIDDEGTFDVKAFRKAVEVVFTAQEIIVGPADYPTEKIGENARAFRQLGLGLREPRRAADGARAPVRLRRRAGVGRRDHRADDRAGVPDQRADRRGDGAVRGLRAERRRDAPGDAQAPRRGRRDRRRRSCPRPCSRPRSSRGTTRSRSGPSTGTGTRRRRCSRRPARSG